MQPGPPKLERAEGTLMKAWRPGQPLRERSRQALAAAKTPWAWKANQMTHEGKGAWIVGSKQTRAT